MSSQDSDPITPVAFMTHHDDPMLFPTWGEAVQYCDDDESPISLFHADDVARLQQENEEQARLLGISGSREAMLRAELERVAGDLNKLRARVESVLWPNSGMAHVTMKG